MLSAMRKNVKRSQTDAATIDWCWRNLPQKRRIAESGRSETRALIAANPWMLRLARSLERAIRFAFRWLEADRAWDEMIRAVREPLKLTPEEDVQISVTTGRVASHIRTGLGQAA